MNGRNTAIGLVLLLSVSVFAGAGLAATTAQSQPEVSVGSDQVSSGSEAAVDITLSEAPDGLQTYQVTIELEDPRVANITGARPGEIRGQGFSVVRMSRSSITLRAADFNERVEKGASRVGLGRVLFNDTYGGRSDISVTVDTLRDDNNSVFDASTSSGELIISGGTPRPTATATPTDTPTPTTTSTPTPTTTQPSTTTNEPDTVDDGNDGDDTPTGDSSTPAENTIPPADGDDGGDDGDDGEDTTTTDTSSGGGPGFTVGLALVALAGVALLARRRN